MSVPKRIESDIDDDGFVLPPMIWATSDETREEFDQRAREMVGMSGEEFLRRLDAGEFADIPDDREHRAIIELGMMATLGR
jgi:hypothetical protein